MAKYDGYGYRIDLDEAKQHIQTLLNGGISKENITKLIPKWAAYHRTEQGKLIEYFKQLKTN